MGKSINAVLLHAVTNAIAESSIGFILGFMLTGTLKFLLGVSVVESI